MSKEAQARIKINKLLESAGWRFLDAAEGKANIALQPNVKRAYPISRVRQRLRAAQPLHANEALIATIEANWATCDR